MFDSFLAPLLYCKPCLFHLASKVKKEKWKGAPKLLEVGRNGTKPRAGNGWNKKVFELGLVGGEKRGLQL